MMHGRVYDSGPHTPARLLFPHGAHLDGIDFLMTPAARVHHPPARSLARPPPTRPRFFSAHGRDFVVDGGGRFRFGCVPCGSPAF